MCSHYHRHVAMNSEQTTVSPAPSGTLHELSSHSRHGWPCVKKQGNRKREDER